MEKAMAERVVSEFKKKNGPQLTIQEVMGMRPITTNSYIVYARQKDDVTFLVWERKDGSIITKTQSW